MTKRIKLTQGKYALVDDGDYDELNKHKWCASTHNGCSYAVRRTGGRINGKMLLMHRVILSPSRGVDVDHINRNGLDNRRSNLRSATRSQNMFNHGPQSNNKSGYKGVCFDKTNRKWVAQVRNKPGRSTFLGRFKTAKEAARAHDEAAKKYAGEFAWLNFND